MVRQETSETARANANSVKSAREMFEALGYKYVYVDGSAMDATPFIDYRFADGGSRERIVFSIPSKRVYVSASNDGFYAASPLSYEEIQAIEQQCVELGWNRECEG